MPTPTPPAQTVETTTSTTETKTEQETQQKFPIVSGGSGIQFAVNVDYKEPSWSDLEKLKKEISLQRKYPRFMKTVMEMGANANTVNMLYFSDELKDLGVNTYVILPHYSFQYSKKKGELALFYSDFDSPGLLNEDEAKRALIHTILMAKQQGLSVILMPDYPDLEAGGMGKMKNPEGFENVLETIALSLAEIAEEYGVEYLVPANAIEMLLYDNDYPLDEVYGRTNEYNANIVPKIRQIYSGKIMYKMGGLGNWERYKNISLEGADLFGFTGCYANESWFIANDIKGMAQTADWLSNKYNVPWMNIEFFVRNEKDQLRDFGEIKVSVPIEEAYQAGIESFKANAQNAVGFTITSWLGVGKVRGTEAVPLLKEFFATTGPRALLETPAPQPDPTPAPSVSTSARSGDFENVGLVVGETAVDFTLQDIHGNIFSLSRLLSEKPVVMVFGSFT